MSTTMTEAMPGKSIFEKDDDFHVKATALLNTFDWDKLIAVASKHRGDPYKLLSKFSIGNANVMRMLIFEMASAGWPGYGYQVSRRSSLRI
jgi:hypothetical protein